MERLTIPDIRIDEHTTRRTIIDGNAVRENAMEFYWRLKKIEDLLGDEYDLDHLSKLVQAEKDGRLVVLPCKVGDTVYRIYDDCDLPGDCYTQRMCKGCEYRNLFIDEQAFCLSMLSQNGMLEHPYYLTREEAEAALKGGQHD